MKSKTSHILALGIIAASSAFVQPATAGPVELVKSVWNAVKGTGASKGTDKTSERTAQVFNEYRDKVTKIAHPSENRILPDGSVIGRGEGDLILVVRPPNVNGSNLSLKIPETNKAFLNSTDGYESSESMHSAMFYKRRVSAEGTGTDAHITFRAGEADAFTTARWDNGGDLKFAQIATPNLNLSIQKSSEKVHVIYAETHRTDPWVPRLSRHTNYQTNREVEIPAGAKLETYALSDTGQLNLHLKASDGTLTVKTIDLRTAEVAKSEATKAESVSQHLQSAASID